MQDGTPSGSPEILIQRSILHGFREMLRGDIFIACQIRDTASNFEKQNEWLPNPQTPCAIETSTIWAEAQRVLCNH
jgi:hypothetical protein